MILRFLATLATLSLLACISPNPDYCDEDRPCMDPASPFCDELGQFPASKGLNNTCIPDPRAADGGLVDSGEPNCDADAGACPLCGNSRIESGEACDGWNLGGKICTDIGYAGGRLACGACEYDVANCYKCGDDNVNDGEECDGQQLDGQSCTTLGFHCGILTCQDDCRFDTSGCNKDWLREVPAPVYGVDIDDSDTIHIAGEFEAPVVIGTTPLDGSNLYVARLSQEGAFQSAIAPTGAISTGGVPVVTDIAVGRGGNAHLVGPIVAGSVSFGLATIAFAGGCGNEFWVTGTNPAGTDFSWATSVGGVESGCDYGTSLSVDGNDNLFVAGSYDGPSAFGEKTAMGRGGFVAKIDPKTYTPVTGGFAWTSTGAGSYSPGSHVDMLAISSDSAGSAFVVGSFAKDAELTPAASPIILLDGPGLFVAKVNHSGTFLWAKHAGGVYATAGDSDYRYVIETDPAGNAYLVGRFHRSATFGDFPLTSAAIETFVAKLNANGTYVWAQQLGAVVVHDIAVSADMLYLTGAFAGEATLGASPLAARGQTDVFLAKMSTSTGQVVSAIAGGGLSVDEGRGLAVSASGHVVVGGTQLAESTFGELTLKAGKGFVWSPACSLP